MKIATTSQSAKDSVAAAKHLAVLTWRRELGNTLDLLRREIGSVLYKSTDTRLKFIVDDRDSFGRPASILSAAQKESGIMDVKYRMVE